MQYARDIKTSRCVHLSSISKENRKQFDLSCLECKSPLILRDGEVNIKHFAHTKDSNCAGHKGNLESHEHRVAKSFICEHLNNGGQIVFESECGTCTSKTQSAVSLRDRSTDSCQEEWRSSVGKEVFIADVAVLRGKEPLAVIEVF